LGPSGPKLLGTFGGKGDVPVPGDYDAVGHAELAVFRPSTGQWFVMGPTGGRLLGTFGAKNLTDLPVPGDYDGTWRTEMAACRPGPWRLAPDPPGGAARNGPGRPGVSTPSPRRARVAQARCFGQGRA